MQINLSFVHSYGIVYVELFRKHAKNLKETITWVYFGSRPSSDIHEKRNSFSRMVQMLIVQSSESTIEFSTYGSIVAGLDTIYSNVKVDISLRFVDLIEDNAIIKSTSSAILKRISDQLKSVLDKECCIDPRIGDGVRVPVIKIHHYITGISLDISIENSNAHKKLCPFLHAEQLTHASELWFV